MVEKSEKYNIDGRKKMRKSRGGLNEEARKKAEERQHMWLA